MIKRAPDNVRYLGNPENISSLGVLPPVTHTSHHGRGNRGLPAHQLLKASRALLSAHQLDSRAAAVFIAKVAKLGEQEMDWRAVRVAPVQDADPGLLLRQCPRRQRCGDEPGYDRAPPHSVAAPTRPWPWRRLSR